MNSQQYNIQRQGRPRHPRNSAGYGTTGQSTTFPPAPPAPPAPVPASSHPIPAPTSQHHLSLPAVPDLYDGKQKGFEEGFEEGFGDDPFGPSPISPPGATDVSRKLDMVLRELHELSHRFGSQEAGLDRCGKAIQNFTQRIERMLQQQMQRLMGWLSQVKAVFEREVAPRGEEYIQDEGLWAQP